MRPDPTPPDASLFPIAPAFTADLDAKALDNIAASLRALEASVGGAAPRVALEDIRAAVRTTGREV
jgi:hypothetical protein